MRKIIVTIPEAESPEEAESTLPNYLPTDAPIEITEVSDTAPYRLTIQFDENEVPFQAEMLSSFLENGLPWEEA